MDVAGQRPEKQAHRTTSATESTCCLPGAATEIPRGWVDENPSLTRLHSDFLPWTCRYPIIHNTSCGIIACPLFQVANMSIMLYGIKACDTVKKARNWLDDRGIAYQFHDYKTQGIERDRLQQWCGQHGWEQVINRNGTTFRKLDTAQKQNLDKDKAIELMLAQPSMIKRPLLDTGTQTLFGFNANHYAALFS